METEKGDELQDEVASLFTLLCEFRSSSNWRNYNSDEGVKDRRSAFTILTIMAFISLVLLILSFLPELLQNMTKNPRVLIQGILMVFYLCGVMIFWQSIDVLKAIFTDQTVARLSDLSDQAQNEVRLFTKLDDYSTESIKFVSKRLEQGSNQIQARIGMFVGAFEKVGLIPGIVATSFALNNALKAAEFSTAESLSIGLALLYFLMMRFALMASRFRHYSFILLRYLELGKRNSQ